MPPRKNPPPKMRNGLYCCPVPGCPWDTSTRTSYSRHCRSDHSTSFQYICPKCTAGQHFLALHERHVGRCRGTKEANNGRRGRKPTYATGRQVREAFPPAEEEGVQELEEMLEQVERDKEAMRMENKSLRKENEELRRKNEELRKEKEDLVTQVDNLELQISERMEPQKQQEGEEQPVVDKGPQVDREMLLGVSQVGMEMLDREAEMEVDNVEHEPTPLHSTLRESQGKDMVEHQEKDNMDLDPSPLSSTLRERPGMLENQEDHTEVQTTPLLSSLRNRQETGMVEPQLVDKVPETGGKVKAGRRKSTRKCGELLKKEKEANIQARLRSDLDSDMLEVVEISGKGRGIKTLQVLSKGDFVAEYSGDLIPGGLAKEKEKEYEMDLTKGSYMYFFQAGSKKYCVDATSESGRLGRLLNHSMLNPNCGTKVAFVDGVPRLYLVANQEIPVGTELVFDYGDRSKASLVANPWLAM